MQAGEPPEASAKRRKTRKGTRSCWECKRRKVRCTFESPTDAVCISCSKRSTECVSQEFPDERTPPAKSRLVGDRFLRVEAMIAQLAERTGSMPIASSTQARKPGRGQNTYRSKIPTPAISDAPTPAVTISSDLTKGPLTIDDRPEEISRSLLVAYPEPAYVDVIAKGGLTFMNTYQTMFRPFSELESIIELPEHEREDLQLLNARHTSKSHPVAIAEQMLALANILHQASAHTLAELKPFSEEPQVVMARLASTASAFIAANDKMMGTAEGLECLMLESIYQANSGNIRLSWLAHRRIAGLAQIIGLHRRHYRSLVVKSIRSNYILDPRFVWYRILYIDRFLGLMLGLPPVSLDSSMVSEPAFGQDTPMGKLARQHCAAAGRILERNDRDPSADDFAYTQSIDMELQRAASAMPSRWWLAPDLNVATSDKQRFWDTQRLINQTYHFYVLHQLHLPYMLLSSSSSAGHGQYDYSRNTCVSASRDILSRCLTFQHHRNFPSGHHIIDLLALMASLTLVLTHLSARSTGGILEHQRLTDRAMIEQTIENMENNFPVSGNEPRNKGVRMLHQLLAIGLDPAMTLGSGMANDNETEPAVHCPLRLFVPYFGVVIVSRDGKITNETIGSERAAEHAPQSHGEGQSDAGGFLAVLRSSEPIREQGQQAGHPCRPLFTQQSPGGQGVMKGSQLGLGPTPLVDESISSKPWFPLPTAGTDQWDLQGVDFAFFDNLMREGTTPIEDRGGGLWH
ncbi:hypothetical protein GQ53DRAFT_708151 [Thozetella sp. PMI_491]|nr:hypothetical protein GQ53DRAFT_708151 [Thozetella sp. PMI_491]